MSGLFSFKNSSSCDPFSFKNSSSCDPSLQKGYLADLSSFKIGSSSNFPLKNYDDENNESSSKSFDSISKGYQVDNQLKGVGFLQYYRESKYNFPSPCFADSKQREAKKELKLGAKKHITTKYTNILFSVNPQDDHKLPLSGESESGNTEGGYFDGLW